MIARLRGTILEKRPNQIILDVNGVGYDVTVPVSTFTALPESGAEAQLHVHTHVREDALALFGFQSEHEKELFERLLTISGIGPRLAVSVLSGLPTADLVEAIRSGQVERLVRIPGVGRKTAERIVLELREKLQDIGAGRAPTVPSAAAAFTAAEQDVLSALLNLGGSRSSAESAVRKASAAGAETEFEPLFRRAMDFLR